MLTDCCFNLQYESSLMITNTADSVASLDDVHYTADSVALVDVYYTVDSVASVDDVHYTADSVALINWNFLKPKKKKFLLFFTDINRR